MCMQEPAKSFFLVAQPLRPYPPAGPLKNTFCAASLHDHLWIIHNFRIMPSFTFLHILQIYSYYFIVHKFICKVSAQLRYYYTAPALQFLFRAPALQFLFRAPAFYSYLEVLADFSPISSLADFIIDLCVKDLRFYISFQLGSTPNFLTLRNCID